MLRVMPAAPVLVVAFTFRLRLRCRTHRGRFDCEPDPMRD